MRRIINLNKDWHFLQENVGTAMNKDFDHTKWESVNVPHTWNAVDGTTGFDYYQGACWYRKNFNIDQLVKGNKVFIEFEGSNSITDVYVNGQHMGQHKGGYSTFRFDITDAIEIGSQNILAVKVDNSLVDDVYPLKADFTFYGGIYRDVNLIISNTIHFDLMDHGSQGVYITQDHVTAEEATLTIKSKLANYNTEDTKVRLWIDILDADNKVVTYGAKEVILQGASHDEIEIPVSIDNPILWHGVKNPYMYKAKLSLVRFNDTLDELIIPFGVRSFYVDPEKGFFLNNEHTALHGVSRHQDRKDMGWAITSKEHTEDMNLIKELGATSIRLAHYQHDQYFYDLCDQEGMVVWAEIPFISAMSKIDLDGTNAKSQMIELIRQNYNHPSIIFWGVQNEIQIGGDRPEVRNLVSELNALTKKEDPTRLTTMANVMIVGNDDPYNTVTDVLGFNHYFGWYQGKAEDFEGWANGFHADNPTIPLCISEYGAEGIIQYHSDEPVVSDYTEEYHALYHEKVWNIFKNQSYLWATYVWNMFDFGANVRDEGGVKGRNNKGLMTYDRKIKKDAFYLYKANWSDEKFVHITSKRFVDRATDTIAVKIYTNCDTVTLYANGIELATKQVTDCTVIFEDILLQAGINKIKVVSSQDNIVLEDSAMFNKVDAPNESYLAPEGEGGVVANWFDLPDFEDVVVKELDISDDVYSTRCTFGELLANEESKAIIVKYLGDLEADEQFGMAKDMSIDLIATIDSNTFHERFMYVLNSELIKIKKTNN